jgi:ubiquitin-conjugating enzyme (huntingtin interacting protein 2)
LRDCQKDKETSGLEVRVPDEANLMHWKGTLKGPTGTPYEGGIFKIDIQLPPDYPFVPPKVRQTTQGAGMGGRARTFGPLPLPLALR